MADVLHPALRLREIMKEIYELGVPFEIPLGPPATRIAEIIHTISNVITDLEHMRERAKGLAAEYDDLVSAVADGDMNI